MKKNVKQINVSILTEEQKERAQLAGELVKKYTTTHFVPENGYGVLFDKFYETPLSELRILAAIHS